MYAGRLTIQFGERWFLLDATRIFDLKQFVHKTMNIRLPAYWPWQCRQKYSWNIHLVKSIIINSLTRTVLLKKGDNSVVTSNTTWWNYRIGRQTCRPERGWRRSRTRLTQIGNDEWCFLGLYAPVCNWQNSCSIRCCFEGGNEWYKLTGDRRMKHTIAQYM